MKSSIGRETIRISIPRLFPWPQPSQRIARMLHRRCGSAWPVDRQKFFSLRQQVEPSVPERVYRTIIVGLLRFRKHDVLRVPIEMRADAVRARLYDVKSDVAPQIGLPIFRYVKGHRKARALHVDSRGKLGDVFDHAAEHHRRRRELLSDLTLDARTRRRCR